LLSLTTAAVKFSLLLLALTPIFVFILLFILMSTLPLFLGSASLVDFERSSLCSLAQSLEVLEVRMGFANLAAVKARPDKGFSEELEPLVVNIVRTSRSFAENIVNTADMKQMGTLI